MIATMTMASQGDSELVQRSLSGDREAFGQIVSRYQALICSLAYSATGNLGESEDLAQETFITAWKHLSHLRDRQRLRAWLCGIARNRINNALRREGHEPLSDARPLYLLEDSAAPGPLPNDHAISNEEAAILWRSLERIPATYREPLILFYRENQSVETVAEHLELTEDAVRQRLARGRKLLQEEVLAFIEGALTRTRPPKAFALAVIASLPGLAISAKAATAGAIVKGGTAAKATGLTSWVWGLLGLLMVFLPNYVAYRVSLAGAQSDEERAGIRSLYGKVVAITVSAFIPLAALVLWLAGGQIDLSVLPGLLASSLVVIFLPTILVLGAISAQKSREYLSRILTEEYNGVFPKPSWEYCSEAKLLGLPLVHIRIGDRFSILKNPVKAWIAVGHAAIGGLFAFGGVTIAPLSFGGFSIGLLSLGGLAIGGIALGGIAAGVWPLFGGLIIGWQAFNGCFAVGWSAAVGLFALARDFALGHFAFAAQVNNEMAREFIFPNPFFRGAELIMRHWLWLNLFWIAAFYVMWRMARRETPQPKDPLKWREKIS